jgi:hypothetical protein
MAARYYVRISGGADSYYGYNIRQPVRVVHRNRVDGRNNCGHDDLWLFVYRHTLP